MLVQDSQTGYFHDVPDYNAAGYGGYGGYGRYGGHGGYGGYVGYGPVVYDGLGNPVGTLGSWWDDIKSAAGNLVRGAASVAASNIPIVGGLVSNMLSPSQAPPQPAPPVPMPAPVVPAPPVPAPPFLPNMMSNMFPGGSPF